MSSSTVIMPLDADRIYVDLFNYNAWEAMSGPKISHVELDVGYSYDGVLTDGYFCYYLAIVFKMMNVDNNPEVVAGISINGEFTPRFGSFPDDASEEQIEEWIGANAISLMYAKAVNVVEQQLDASPIGHVSLPVINPYTVWKYGLIEDNDFWADLYHGDFVQAFKVFHERYDEGETLNPKSLRRKPVTINENESIDTPEATIDRSKDRGTEGVWTMTDDGRFELNEPFKTKLMNAKFASTQAWHDALLDYLAENTQYTREELRIELLRRNQKESDKTKLFDEFVLEALSGDL